MSLFESQVFSKEEKQIVLNDLAQLKSNLDLLKSGSPEALEAVFSGIVSLIDSFSTPEEKDILEIQKKINESLVVVDDTVEYIKQSKIEIENNKKSVSEHTLDVNKLQKDCLKNAADVTEHLTKAADSLTEILEKKNKYSEIVNEIEQLIAKSELAQTKLETFEQAVADVEDSKTKVTLLHKNMRELLLEVKTLHAEVLGSEEKDETTGDLIRTDGLVDKLSVSYVKTENDMLELRAQFETLKKEKQTEYGQIKTDWEQQFSDLKNRIESLLPGALSAGLSQAYEEKKNAEIKEIEKSSIVFYIAIAALILISAVPAVIYAYLLITGKKTLDEILLLAPNVLLFMLPVYLPCLWVAISADKKSKLAKRLAEEYAHKAALSKTFEGISKQVSNLSDSKLSADLESKLLSNIIQVSSENPGKLISDYNKSDHPLFQALDSAFAHTEALGRISFIPGVDKLREKAQKVTQQRANDIVAKLKADDFALTESPPKETTVN